MTVTATRSSRHSTRLLSYSHLTVDFYQGAIAALVPFLVLERGYTYASAAGIVLAATLSSSLVQPLFGILSDKWQMRWLIPVSIFLAGAGIAAIGVAPSFWSTATVAAISGIGVAAFHPAGASRARQLSGNDHVLMSWFALGGNIGFAIAPLLVAATVGIFGLQTTPLLMLPAVTGMVAIAFVARVPAELSAAASAQTATPARNDWPKFLRLSVAIVCRSIVFVSIGSFIVLFMYQYRGISENLAAAALFVFYLGGAFGTAIGGYLARRWPRTTILRSAYLAAIPVLAGMLLLPGPLAYVFVALASVVLYIPFSLHLTLGQDYLPRNMGTASGVTLGLAVSVGGIASPVIGALADRIGLEYALLPLIGLPALAFLVLLGLNDPFQRRSKRTQPSRQGSADSSHKKTGT